MKILFITVFLFAATTTNAQSVNKLLVEANELYGKADFNKSVELYKQVLLVEPNNVIANNNLGLAYYKMENFDESINCFKKITEQLNESNLLADVYYNLGVTYAKKSLFADALATFKNALKLNPNNKKCSENLQLVTNQLNKQQQGKNDKTETKDNKDKQPNDSQDKQDIKNSQGGNSSNNEDELLSKLAEDEKEGKKNLQKKQKSKSGNNVTKDW